MRVINRSSKTKQPRKKRYSRRVHTCDDSSGNPESGPEFECIETATHESVNAINIKNGAKVYAKMCGDIVHFQIDTGATCNVVNKSVVPEKCKIEQTTTKLRMYNTSPILTVGKTRIPVINPANKAKYIIIYYY